MTTILKGRVIEIGRERFSGSDKNRRWVKVETGAPDKNDSFTFWSESFNLDDQVDIEIALMQTDDVRRTQ